MLLLKNLFLLSITACQLTFNEDNSELVGAKQTNRHDSRTIIYKCAKNKEVALTFDDGISSFTKDLLNVLEECDVRATFFIVGQTLNNNLKNEKLLREIFLKHDIGSHSWSHPNLTKLSEQEIFYQVKASSDIIEKTTGKRPAYFRPPEGYENFIREFNEKVIEIVSQEGMQIVMWDVDSNDWRHQGCGTNIICDNILEGLSNSSCHIILQHDLFETSVLLQPNIIRKIREKGFKIVSMEECIGNQ